MTLRDFYQRAISALDNGQSDVALALLEQGLKLATTMDRPRPRASFAHKLALLWEQMDRPGHPSTDYDTRQEADIHRESLEQAVQYYRTALAAYREFGNRRGEAQCLQGLGSGLDLLGKHREAIAPLRRALLIARALKDQESQLVILLDLATNYEHTGQDDEAFDFNNQGLQLAKQTGSTIGQVVALSQLAGLNRRRGDYEQALRQDRQALRTSGPPRRSCTVHNDAG